MITFNTADFNLKRIQKESELADAITKHQYRIYGLKNSGNPLVHMEIPEKFYIKALEIQKFLAANNIISEISEESTNEIAIGIRKDLREHVALSTALVQTITYGFEGRVKLSKKYKIPGIPKFATIDKIKKQIKYSIFQR